MRTCRKSHRAEKLQIAALAAETDLIAIEVVAHQLQRPLGNLARIEQLERSSSKVARISKWLFTFGDALTVKLLEITAEHVHLPPDLEVAQNDVLHSYRLRHKR
ncbi:hypothetical protein HRbin20_00479 [bacterium HR20]|nr:hypothetical protein HRbin20_00479 [bacterium HR20]